MASSVSASVAGKHEPETLIDSPEDSATSSPLHSVLPSISAVGNIQFDPSKLEQIEANSPTPPSETYSEVPINRSPWVPDAEVNNCFICDKSFGWFTRKHHCRVCGRITCADCASKQMELPQYGYVGLQRVCDACYRSITETREKQQNQQDPVVLEDTMQLCDHHGVIVGPHIFQLTRLTLRWRSKVLDTRQGVFLKDILVCRPQRKTEFVLHWFPIVDKTTKSRTEDVVWIRCTDPIIRDTWVARINSLLGPHPVSVEHRRRFMVLINPFGGEKKAPRIWAKVQHVFRFLPIELSIFETQYVEHALEIARDVAMGEFDGIICCSGDGIIHEVINGFMRREDWRDAIRIPISPIPAGTGNGLAASMYNADPLTAAFNICKGYKRRLDIIKVVQQSQPARYCLLSVNWGLISDVDFESEKYRYLGLLRLTVGAVVRMLDLRIYRGRLSFVPADTPETTICAVNECAQCMQNQQEEFELVDDYFTDADKYKWEVIEGDFVLAVGCNVAFISSDVRIAPFAHFSDGACDLVCVGRCTRAQLAEMFLELESGKFVNRHAFNLGDYVIYKKAKAFKLEPLTEEGMFGFDGERPKTYEPLHVSVLRGLLTVLG